MISIYLQSTIITGFEISFTLFFNSSLQHSQLNSEYLFDYSDSYSLFGHKKAPLLIRSPLRIHAYVLERNAVLSCMFHSLIMR